jgi:hypothetical protein
LERLACHKHSGLFRVGEGGEEKEEECVTVTINQYVNMYLSKFKATRKKIVYLLFRANSM